MLLFPNAKINIGLSITERRADGYHNLQSIFYPVEWKDALEFLPAEKESFTSTGINIPSDGKRNLIQQAYDLLASDYSLPPLSMHLHKAIPIGAGLGGGSADASFMLKALNAFFDLKINDFTLENYAKRLGADCPFFINNKATYVEGIGDVFSPIELDLKGYYILLLWDETHLSTAMAYQHIKPSMPERSLRKKIQQTPLEQWKGIIHNDFEKSAYTHFPHLQDEKQWLYDQGAIYASMTGSGSAHYGIFKELPKPSVYQKRKGKSFITTC